MELNHLRAGLQPAALPIELPIRLVERVGVEPTKPLGRLDYSQDISPMKASPNHRIRKSRKPPIKAIANLELTVSVELTTCCLQDSCSAV